MKKISTVMVTFNNIYDTLSAVDSLFRSDYSNIEAIVVDNGSAEKYHEKLREELKSRFPAVDLLHLEEDKGYGHACNEGAQILIGRGAEVLLFLNNDLVLDSSCISNLITNFREENAALVGPKVYRGFSDILYSAGGFAKSWLTTVHNRGNGEQDKGRYDTREEVEFINGCAFMISAEVFTEAEGFDEKFYYYSEETDLCYRIIKKGYKIIYEPSAIAYHWASTTIGVGSKRALYYLARNHLYFVRKHAGNKLVFFYNLFYIFYRFILKFAWCRLGQILTRIVAVLKGIKDSMIGKVGRGPYG